MNRKVKALHLKIYNMFGFRTATNDTTKVLDKQDKDYLLNELFNLRIKTEITECTNYHEKRIKEQQKIIANLEEKLRESRDSNLKLGNEKYRLSEELRLLKFPFKYETKEEHNKIVILERAWNYNDEYNQYQVFNKVTNELGIYSETQLDELIKTNK